MAEGMRRSLGTAAIVTVAVLIVGTHVDEVEAGWQRPHGDSRGSNRAPGHGQLRGDVDQHPGFAEVLELERPELPAITLRDVTGDEVPEVLLPYRGRVAALDMTTGTSVWQSPEAGIDSIVDFADFNGDGSLELLAASRGVGGSLVSLDPATGAILYETAPLPLRSGVDAAELAIADLDQDGDDDVVYPAGLFGLGQFWVSGLGLGAEQWSVSLEFSGYSNVTPARVGRFSAGGAPSLLIDQGPTQRLFERCEAAAPSAACGGAVCLCPAEVFYGVHPGVYAFGSMFVADVEGDGLDEVLTIADNPRYTRSLSAFSPAKARATGSGAGGQLWYRDYSQGPATTIPLAPRQAPRDLDLDGNLELLVSFVDNLDDDLDLAGQPISDGIDHAGLSVAVFDARTGEVQASLEGGFGHGFIDLDDDGRPEIVASPVSGYAWQTGLRGFELGCDDGCLEQVWSAPHAFAPAAALEIYDGEYVPRPNLLVTRVDGRDALLAYLGDSLHVLRFVDGQLASTASRSLTTEQSVVGVSDGFALLSDGRELQLVDAQLQAVGPAMPIPVQGAAAWMTARLDGFDAAIYDAKLHGAPLPDGPEGFGEPVTLLPTVALTQDLDGQGSAEIIDFRRPKDELGPGFEVRMLAWEQGQLQVRWSVVGDEQPALAGLELPGAMHFATGNFNGQGAEDLLFLAHDTARDSYLVVVDGDDGAILRVHPATTPGATATPLLVADLANLAGQPIPDGIDDVLIDGPVRLELVVFGHDGPAWTGPTSFYHAVGAQADVDGDGHRELIATISSTLDNLGAALDFDEALLPNWGPLELGLPTGRFQVLSFAHVDGEPGIDMLYITGEGGLELRSGQTGALLPGAPAYLAGGKRVAAPVPDAASLAALLVMDVDDDGHDEAIIGAEDGWVYAVNLTHAETSIEWSLEVGAPVSQLAAGDVDGDGFEELLVSTRAGQGIVLDSLGVSLEITSPDADCLEVGTVEVTGTAHGIALVDLFVNGVLVDSVAVEGSEWTAELELPGPGEHEARAEGRDQDGELVAISTTTITYGGDEDGDGVSACGGDCDDLDPETSPEQVEICGDGIDQDCDGEDLPCSGDDDGTGSFPGRDPFNPRGRCNCSIEPEDRRDPWGPISTLVLLAIGWTTRARRSRPR